MNFIDISSWQSGMNLRTMFDNNPSLDGVIVKVSQGTSYVNPPSGEWLTWLVRNNKPLGMYHYLDLYGAEAEARHFVDVARPYIGKGILSIDYEGNTVRKGTGYLKQCLDEVYRLTGVKAYVYVSQSFIASQDFGPIAEAGYPLWLAQYADMNPVYGFIDHPWQKGSFSPFPVINMHQYTSCGRLKGWNDNLDFDLFYGSVEDWGSLPSDDSQYEPVKRVNTTVVLDVISGKYGIGNERVRRLAEDGYNPVEVQSKINELYGIAQSCKKYLSGNEDYMNAIVRIVRLL